MKLTVNQKDAKIQFISSRCKNKIVLDLGCVQHDLEKLHNGLWIHGSIKEVASELIGLDYLEEEVKKLNELGFNIVCGNAELFELNRKFDVIVAGDIIEHLNNFGNFLESCVNHMATDGRLIITSANPWHWHKIIKAS